MSIVKKIFLAAVAVVLTTTLVFCLLLSDQQRAAICLSTLGLPAEKEQDFSQIVEILRYTPLTKWTDMSTLPSRDEDLLNDYLSQSVHCPWPKRCSLADLYATTFEDWNGGCTISGTKKLMKFDHLLSGKDALVLAYWGGGLAAGLYYDFYRIQPTGLLLVGSTRAASSLFEYALLLRFDPHLIEWLSENRRHEQDDF